jgi:methylglutaconyl-CoA hydratase
LHQAASVAAIGERVARPCFLAAERFDAGEAWRLGLVHELVDAEAELDERIARLCEAMLACARSRSARRRSSCRAGKPMTSELIQDTAQRIARLRASPEGQDGVAAFLEKRRAAWLCASPNGRCRTTRHPHT